MEEMIDTVKEEKREEKAPATPAEESVKENPKSGVDYEALAASDILSLKAEFPDLFPISSLTELENPTRYAELRDLGLSPREAYLATTRRNEKREDNRSHLQSAVPRTVVGSAEGITREELIAARELFSGLSDHEIRKLYKKVTE